MTTLAAGCGKRAAHAEPNSPSSVFEVMDVNEDCDVAAVRTSLPAQLSVRTENVDGHQRSYLAFIGAVEQRAQAATWAREYGEKPAGSRWAWGAEPGEEATTQRSYCLREPPLVTGADVATASVVATEQGGEFFLSVKLNALGASRFGELTRARLGHRIAILVDGAVQMAPRVQSEISGGSLAILLAKNVSRAEADLLAAKLQAAAR